MNSISSFCKMFRSTTYNRLVKSRNIVRSCQSLCSRNVTDPSNNITPSHETGKGKMNEVTITELNPEDEKRLKILKLEYDVFFSTGIQVPDVMIDKNWMYLLYNCTSCHGRKNYYSHLFKLEKSRASKKVKSEISAIKQEEKRLEILKKIEAGEIENFKNRYMLLLIESTMNKHNYNNLYWAMLNGGQRIVFDFSFEDRMKFIEIKDLVKQVFASHGHNKVSKDPFHFHFCNLSKESQTYKKIASCLNTDISPITISSDSYLNHYPKEKLVYLTPNAKDDLKFNPDDIYIIGSLVDKSDELPVTIAKAKEEGIRTAKFPLDKYVKWVKGSKALSLNHVMSILDKVKISNDWAGALTSSLPSRKFEEVTNEEEFEELKMKSYNRQLNKSYKPKRRS